MKKLLTLSFFMLFAIMMQAAKLYVGGVLVTDDNSANITGKNISGKVSYDKTTSTLTLKNATITVTGSTNGIYTNTNLTICLIGTNTIITEESTAIYGYFFLGGKLIIMSSDGKGVLNLTGGRGISSVNCGMLIENCTVNATGNEYGITGNNIAPLFISKATVTAKGGTYGSIVGFTKITLSKTAILSPAGAKIKNGSVVNTNGEETNLKITITPKGDVNNDSNINIDDVTTLSDKLLDKSVSKFTQENADMDNNGKINIVDIAQLEDILLHGGYKYVDLGLSVKWATMNIGAEKPEDYGLYFAWGATRGYTSDTSDDHSFNWEYAPFNEGNSNYSSSAWEAAKSTVVDSNDNLLPAYDAATANWGGRWRMPTYFEATELRFKCYREWTDNYNNTGVSGCIVYKVKDDSDKGKFKTSNGSTTTVGTYSLSDTHIFMPAAGYCNYRGFCGGSYGCYWSSTLSLYRFDHAWHEAFCESNFAVAHDRCYGQSVRAVCP